jgi:hypothetical protein
MLFRFTQWNAGNSVLVFGWVLTIAISIAVLWGNLSTDLSQNKAWAGWLALTATIQPLAGFHSFVLAIPLAALAIDSAFDVSLPRTVKRNQQILAVSGLLATTVITQKVGPIGQALQAASVKSWGVLMLLASLLVSPKSRPSQSYRTTS